MAAGFIEETPESSRNLVAVKKIGYPVASAEAVENQRDARRRDDRSVVASFV